VVANGGSVSATTFKAVSDFCKSIDQDGIRDRFYRLNLFCGSALEACLVPLYRAPSKTDTQLGGTTDTNFNFVSGDYAETGASSGLLGNGSSKYLSTGFSTNDLDTAATGHLSVFMAERTEVLNQFRTAAGLFSEGAEPSGQQYAISVMGTAAPASRHSSYWGGGALNHSFANLTTPANLYTVTRTSSTSQIYYGGATSLATLITSITPAATAKAFFVFRANLATAGYFNSRLLGYSIGRSLTASQVSSYNSAYAALNTALGRT
jgi:hypothetical protein